ncbi:MAG TPA: trehalose-6-phosphate synthase [Acidimicrobiales bacterium]|nr:trehalose-6-phosphate synthase [Acidimicrobiales bacterium]
MGQAGLVIASNRGPVSFALDAGGRPVASGSAGGLAAALYPLVEGSGATWVSCAMSEADRKAAAAGLTDELDVPLVTVQPDPATYRMAYDVVSNSTLWNCHHHLFDLSRRPVLDHRFDEAFDAYRSFNAQFADAVAAAAGDGATVLVQDYHLCLLPGLLASRRPDLRVVHFSHTPFAEPGLWRVLPVPIGRELLAGLAGGQACGFHAPRWEAAFLACCADAGVEPPPTFVSPLSLAPDALMARAASPACTAAAAALDDLVAGRRLVVRTDRIEPSKNLLRGFWAFDELLRHRRDLRGEVVMVAHAYPSRQSLPEYLAYGAEVEQAAARVNETWGDARWTPVVLDIADDAVRSLAALTRYDVLLVNPLRDGLNLVAKEGPVVNANDGVLTLSREAGAFEELRHEAIEINPFDVSGTAIALADALDLPDTERKRRAEALRVLATARPATAWLDDQLAAAAGRA